MIQVLVPDRDAEFLVASLRMSSAALLNLRTVLQGVDDIQRMIDAQDRLADQILRMIAHQADTRKRVENAIKLKGEWHPSVSDNKEVSQRKVFRGEDSKDA